MRDRADEALPCNRPLTSSGTAGSGTALRRAQGPWGQGAPFDPSTGSGTAELKKEIFTKINPFFFVNVNY